MAHTDNPEERENRGLWRTSLGIIALDCSLFLVFYLEFFPKAFLAQASALTGLASGLLTLLGMEWGRGSLAVRLSKKRTFTASLVFLAMVSVLLLVGLTRPFEVRTVPRASIYLDGKLLGTAPSMANSADDGLVTVPVYTSWESHDFASEKQYFRDMEGEQRSSQSATWWQMHLLPSVQLRMRSCLGPAEEAGEWLAAGEVNNDISTPQGVGEQALRMFLVAVDHLSTSGYAKLPVAVQCGTSVELKRRVVQKPFSSGFYLGIVLKPGVQARVDVDASTALPDRVAGPAKGIAKEILRLLAIDSDDVLMHLESEIDRQSEDLLVVADRAAVEELKSTLKDLSTYLDPCECDAEVKPHAEIIAVLSKPTAEVTRFTRLATSSSRSGTQDTDAENIVDSLEQLGRLAVYVSAVTQTQEIITGLTAIEQNSKNDAIRQRAHAAIVGIPKGPKPCGERRGRNPQTGRVVRVPRHLPTPYHKRG